MKQWISLLLTVLLLCTPAAALEQPSEEELSIGAPSAILIERETGTVLYEKNADERLSPASVTKIMTLLLIFEQLTAVSSPRTPWSPQAPTRAPWAAARSGSGRENR